MLVYHQYWSPWNSVWNFVVLRLACWRTWQRQSIWFIYGKILLKVVMHCWTMLTVLNKNMKGEAENVFLIGILFVCFFFFKHSSSSSLKIPWSITWVSLKHNQARYYTNLVCFVCLGCFNLLLISVSFDAYIWFYLFSILCLVLSWKMFYMIMPFQSGMIPYALQLSVTFLHLSIF